MSLLNKKAVREEALRIALDKFNEQNRTRKELGLALLNHPESRISKHFLDMLESRLRTVMHAMVHENKTGITL